MPVGNPVTDRLARLVKPSVPVSPTAKDPWPSAGIALIILCCSGYVSEIFISFRYNNTTE